MSGQPRKRQIFPLDALSVGRGVAEPLQRQLYRTLADLIRRGVLPAGSELPSTRELALDLKIGRNTVVAAYDQLATEGYLASRAGARAVVVDLPAEPEPADAAAAAVVSRSLAQAGVRLMAQPVHHGTPGHVAFHPGIPDSAHFPFGVLSRLLARRAAHAGHNLFGTYHITGLPELREAIAGYLAAARGVSCTPDQVVITTGAQAAFDLLSRLLIDPGDHVWMEEPGYYAARAAFAVAGATFLPLPVDGDGWHLEAPESAPRIIYVTPACQHPLGITMRAEQRQRLHQLAERFDSWIIEDDFDGEYRFQGRPVPALQSTDRSARVIYVGTFTKLMFPALRLGFIVLPRSFPPGISRALGTTGQFAPLMLQAALADFIAEGHLSRHLKRMRRLYAERRQAFYDTCNRELGDFMRLLPSEAGIQVVARLNDHLDDRTVALAAATQGVNVSPFSQYFRAGRELHGLILGYAACDAPQTARGISALRRAFVACRA
ncbi:MAG: PLP-dependent aminotransferase family protein [Rubellimicrobium sp.]|nr:PLP-dependent aminotransferase family protein [Rubellimicrobium sp.]